MASRFRRTNQRRNPSSRAAPGAPPPRAPLDFPIPRIKFGVELEMNFVIKRHLFWEWLRRDDPRPIREDVRAGNQYFSLDSDESDDSDDLFSDDSLFGSDRSEMIARRKERKSKKEQLLGAQDGAETRHSRLTTIGGTWYDPHWMAGRFKGRSASTLSKDTGLQLNVRKYIVDFLNGRITNPPPPYTESPLGEVVWTGYHATDNHFVDWVLTEDRSIGSSRETWARKMGKDLETEIKPYLVVGGAEIVSPALTYNDFDWTNTFRYLYHNIQYNGQQGMWLNGEGIHVHMSLDDEDLTLDVIKNVIILYSIFEDQIERWIHVRRRHASYSTVWAKSLRIGMEMPLHRSRSDIAADYPPLRYTPKGFISMVDYLTSGEFGSVKRLKLGLTGEGNGLPTYRLEAMEPWEWEGLKYMAVNISLPRDSKPLTLEFRQHEGTEDANSMIWWVKFCGHLLHHAYTLAQAGFQITDFYDPDIGYSFVDQFVGRKHILDIISFPQEGKVHFEKKALALHNQQYEDELALENLLILERIKREAAGEKTGAIMDNEIMRETWWRDRATQLSIQRDILERQGELADCPRNPAYNLPKVVPAGTRPGIDDETSSPSPTPPPVNLATNF